MNYLDEHSLLRGLMDGWRRRPQVSPNIEKLCHIVIRLVFTYLDKQWRLPLVRPIL